MASSLFAASVPTVIVHVSTSGASEYISGVLGGLTALVGVGITEILVRVRERRHQLNSALSDMHAAVASNLGGLRQSQSQAELQDMFTKFATAVTRIKVQARRPLRNAAKIRDEADAIHVRLAVALARWERDNVPPLLGPVVGDHISELVLRGDMSVLGKVDAGLEKAGFDPKVYGPTARTDRDIEAYRQHATAAALAPKTKDGD